LKHGDRVLLALYFGECQYDKGFSGDCKSAGWWAGFFV
jgi:hypothetical protein